MACSLLTLGPAAALSGDLDRADARVREMLSVVEARGRISTGRS
ncbi:hypothetical protein ACWEIJ_13120 [Lentzea sp. NPDC004789]